MGTRRLLSVLSIGFVVLMTQRLVGQEPESTSIDCFSIKADLKIPAIEQADDLKLENLAGKRFRESVLEGEAAERAYHVTYLPADWKPRSKSLLPLIIEFAGNGPYRNRLGDRCTGKVEDCKLGYGISGGKRFIWVCLPFLNEKGTANVTKWWGDAPGYDAGPTVEYCKRAIPWICERWGADPERVLLVGFSRGAIACNVVGLHDDEIAKLWRGFVAYSHYDGVKPDWPFPNSDRKSAAMRLKRLGDRPQFICGEAGNVKPTQAYLATAYPDGQFTFRTTGVLSEKQGVERFSAFRNHNDAWILRPNETRQTLRKWVTETLR